MSRGHGLWSWSSSTAALKKLALQEQSSPLSLPLSEVLSAGQCTSVLLKQMSPSAHSWQALSASTEQLQFSFMLSTQSRRVPGSHRHEATVEAWRTLDEFEGHSYTTLPPGQYHPGVHA